MLNDPAYLTREADKFEVCENKLNRRGTETAPELDAMSRLPIAFASPCRQWQVIQLVDFRRAHAWREPAGILYL